MLNIRHLPSKSRDKRGKMKKAIDSRIFSFQLCGSILYVYCSPTPGTTPLPHILYPADHSLPSTAGEHRTASCDQAPQTSSCPCSSDKHHTLPARRLCIFDIALVSVWLQTRWEKQRLGAQVLTAALVS